jgi:dolichol-phosphate mannosyltransferase
MTLSVTTSPLLPPSGELKISAFDDFHSENQSPKLSLILPTYNEGNNIKKIVEILTQLLETVLPNNYELIVVDDDSPDRTWEIAQNMTVEYPQLKVIRRETERGLSTAVIRGWQVAKGEILGVIDADLQHPPEILLKLLGEIEKGADLAVASRHVEGGGVSDWSLIRRFLSRGAQTLGLILLPHVLGRLSDPMSGYFMVRRQAIAGYTLDPVGYKILIEVVARGKIRWIGEVGYVFQERNAGESKVTWRQYVEYLQHLLKLRLSLFPIKQFLKFGLVGFSGVFVDMIILYLLSDPNSLGWGLTRSKIIAAEIAILNNFFWNDAWTFAEVSINQKGNKKRFKRFLKFNTICLAGLILNVLLLNIQFNLLGFNELPYGRYIANFIAIGIVTIWNFWLNFKLSWRVTDIEE